MSGAHALGVGLLGPAGRSPVAAGERAGRVPAVSCRCRRVGDLPRVRAGGAGRRLADGRAVDRVAGAQPSSEALCGNHAPADGPPAPGARLLPEAADGFVNAAPRKLRQVERRLWGAPVPDEGTHYRPARASDARSSSAAAVPDAAGCGSGRRAFGVGGRGLAATAAPPDRTGCGPCASGTTRWSANSGAWAMRVVSSELARRCQLVRRIDDLRGRPSCGRVTNTRLSSEETVLL